jgi:hypothetical protein
MEDDVPDIVAQAVYIIRVEGVATLGHILMMTKKG